MAIILILKNQCLVQNQCFNNLLTGKYMLKNDTVSKNVSEISVLEWMRC